MAPRVFFSFHYERDVQRASVIRNSWVTKPNKEDAGFIDSASWESLKRQGDAAIRRWIDEQLRGTTVTAVLIGPETSSRDWVRYEVLKSHERGNGLVGITLHNIRDFLGKTEAQGDSFFGELGRDHADQPIYFFQVASVYDWVRDSGYENLGDWIEEAARKARR